MTARVIVAAVFVAALAGAACTSAPDKGIDAVAEFYVERQLDSLPVEPVDSMAPLRFDSTALDSITANWSPDDWIEFWQTVERKKPF